VSLSKLDLAVVRREREVPGMGHLLDAERFCALLSSGFPELDPGSVRLGYLRYKPGMNCLTAFELSSERGRLRGYAKALRPSDAAKLGKRSGKIVDGEQGAGRWVFEQPSILVHFHPNDRKLRSLRHVGVDQTRNRILHRACAGRATLAEAELHELAYKPERRFVGQLRSGGKAVGVLKLYSKPAFARRNTLLEAARSTPGVRIPRVLGTSSRNSLLVLEWLEGDLLREVLQRPGSAARVASRVGAALAEFHRFGSDGTCARRASIDKQLLAAAGFVAALDPEHSEAVHKLATCLSQPLDRRSGRLCTLHGDLHSKQIVIRDRQVALIDLDTACVGEPELDLGNFIGHLVRDGIGGRIPEDDVELCREELLSGYRQAGGEFDMRKLDVHVAAALLLLAPHPFRVREPDWRRRTRRILRYAALLEERARTAGATVGSRLARGASAGARPEQTVESLFRRGAAAGSSCSVDRVDLVAGSPLLSVRTPTGRRWFHSLDGGLLEFMPTRDPKLPLARSLVGSERILAYRPLRRLVVECETERGPLIVKGYRRGRAARMESLYSVARRAAAGSGFRVPAVLARTQASESLLFEHLPGRPLVAEPGSEATYREVGAALARFQSVDTNGHLPPFSALDELGVLDAWSSRVRELGDRLPAGWSEIRRRLDAIEGGLPEARAVPTHRDLHDGQFLESDEGIALLDFDLLCRADGALDPANLLCHFELRSLQGRQSEQAAMACRRSFLEGFAAGGERFEGRLAFYQTTTYLRLALVYALRPRWRSLSSPLVDRARRTLDEARAS
jgi:aminoglycoside phosphotransferase (APT) family kinase protein